MTKIYLIRHAEAEGNVYRRIHGQYDSRVTPNGLRQIEALKERFASLAVDACYASDLNRTCVTARAVYRPKGLTLRTDPRLRELNLGRWEDLPFGWLERFETERMWQFNHDQANWVVEDGETYAQCTARAFAALREIGEENVGKTAAVFTHGCLLRSVQSALTGAVPYCDNTAVSLLTYENGAFSIDYLNDSSHLNDEISTFARQKWWRETGDRKDFNMWFEADGDTGRAMLHDEQVGLVRLSGERCEKGALRIAELCLDAAYQGRRLGEQLLGYAISAARQMACDRLVADVPEENERALRFFVSQGFVRNGSENGCACFTLDISVPQR